MLTIKSLISCVNYLFCFFYGFTVFDIIKKISADDFYLGNITNFFQLLLTIIGVLFAYYKLLTYRRDSATKSRMLEQDAENKEIELFFKRNAKEIKENEMLFTKLKNDANK